jgi:organic radical activating enzyme
MKSKTFCVMPWNSLATNASGIYRVCCNSTPGKNTIKNENGEPLKIYTHLPSEAWNSPTYIEIRKQMLNGERPEMCERCFKEEDAGLESARINWNRRWYDPSREYSIREKPNIEYVDLRLGNLCNLKCRMCNPYSSNQWIEEWNSVVTKAELVPNFKISDEEAVRLSKMDWPTKIKTWESLIEIADTIEEIYLTGGEPTLAIEQYKLFDILIEKDLAKNIKLKYNTNLTNIPKKMVEYWEKFKKIQINASIDAYGELNRYIRYPTSWTSVEKNMDRFVTMPNVEVQLHCTVQTYNILNLNDLFNWMKNYENIKLYLNILNHPRSLNIRILPKQLKLLAEQRLEPYLDLPKVKETIKYMNSVDDDQYLDEFFNYNNTLDSLREQNFYDLVPEFKVYDRRNYGME